MLRRSLAWALGLSILAAPPVLAQPSDDAPARSSKVSVQRWRFGTILTAKGGAFRSITATVTVPMDWPEQRVRIVEEDFSPGVKVSYQPVEDMGRQMVIKVPHLAAGAEARAIVTLEIKRLLRPAPEDTDGYVLPEPKRLDRKLAAFLAPSPYIESNDAGIRAEAKALVAGKEKPWDRVKAIYDWVQSKIQYEDNQGKAILSAVEALRAGKGDCDEITSLFVAVCRAGNIPARSVRVPGHCYPEFYLLDAEGRGHWFPCQSAGTPSFGAIPDLRPILQKGDSVLLPDPRTRKRVRYRFFPENVIGMPVGSGGSLEQRPVCEIEK